MSTVLLAHQLWKTYRGGDGGMIEVLRGVDLEVATGEFVAVTGESGSGKSTLLHLLGALDVATAGRIALAGQEYARLDVQALAALRNRAIGFVFQFHHLLRDFTAVENVAMPLLIAGEERIAALGRARMLLDAVRLGARATHLPAQLSGG
ncbi:MAG: ATP-binding cassette domain-containing protein, partial [Gemmatimonadales bacterium]|nr:ATP-binding cassette domain-containing protein [Gemmatimonadales bacterium]